jgi:hypothetical protein
MTPHDEYSRIVSDALRARLTTFVAMVLDGEPSPLLALGVLAAVIEGLSPDLPQGDRQLLADYLRSIADQLERQDEKRILQ